MSTASLPDDRLVKLAAGGDAAAFEAIYERYHQAVYRYGLSILGDPQDAQDALQSTMERALRSIAGQRVAGGLKAWLFGIAHNEAMDLIGRRAPASAQAEIGAAAADVAIAADERERLRQLTADLGTLPERQRSALVLRELSGLDSEEIGSALSISPSAAKQSVYEARVALTKLAKGRDMSCGTIQQRISAGDGRRLRGRGVRAHVRDCAICQAFQAGIASRTVDFPVLFPPLAAAAAAKTLAAVTGGGVGGAALSGAGAAGDGASVGGGDPTGPGGTDGGAESGGGSVLRDRRAAIAGVGVATLLLFAGVLEATRDEQPQTVAAPTAQDAPAEGEAAPAEAAPAQAGPAPKQPEPAAESAENGPPELPSPESLTPASVAGYTQLEPSVTTLLAGDGSGGGGSGGDGTTGSEASGKDGSGSASSAGSAGGGDSAGSGGSLAFTGLDVLVLAAGGLGLLGVGLLMRRTAGRRPA